MGFMSEIISEKITARLSAQGVRGVSLEVYDCVDSTNTLLKKQADEGAPHGRVIIAREQTGGRGRMGRSFHSPRGTGLYISILLRPEMPPESVLLVTPMTAVAVCQALDSAQCPTPRIKWVNDIYVGGKKLAGILTEGKAKGGFFSKVFR